MITTLVAGFIILCIVALVLFGISKIENIPPMIKTVAYVIAGVIILLWMLNYVQSGHLGALR